MKTKPVNKLQNLEDTGETDDSTPPNIQTRDFEIYQFIIPLLVDVR